jgi:hypothetical protein
VKRTARYVYSIVLAVGGVVAICIAIWFVGNRIACKTEARLKIEDPAGLNFEIEETTCATLVTEKVINVYARKADRKGSIWIFIPWINQRTLIFRYRPERENSPFPAITHPSRSTLLISIPEVSSIDYRNLRWANMSINYDIGRVYYPAESK